LVYSVDEVSDRLDIPRPTLYRYLREYSIPHLRQAGKISIPEESFDQIREARALHREGLGTESVRRKLREENDLVDVEELADRLDWLSGALERLREDLKPANGAPGTQEDALQTLHEKQDTLISGVSRLHRMVEELSNAERRLQRKILQGEPSGSVEGIGEPEVIYGGYKERTERNLQAASNAEREPALDDAARGAVAEPTKEVEPAEEVDLAEEVGVDEDLDPTTRLEGHEPSTKKAYSKSGEPFVVFTRGERFGALTRGRLRWVLMLLVALLVLLVAAVLVWGLIAPDESVQDQTSSDEPEVQQEPQSASDTNESRQAIEVPGLVGSALPEAEEEIGEAGLELGTVDEISSYAVPAGTVAAQEPAVGVEVDPDAPVNVMVSNGPPGAPGR
jgi:PASTA domain/Helix-turn-helix domain